ncbi:MAG: hypothetical protein JNM34_06820 [Chthonomonadaceae bacterium]|nr:hypothetical protein [Chthonomonadaceae bacterium]
MGETAAFKEEIAMSFRVNNNTVAMNAYRNLSGTGSEIAKSINRLSTGLRINSGADDPAGLIASENFRRQISGMDAALRNNQDAMNYAKTADGALDEVSRLLRDARALTVANGNSTVDANQKQANQTQLNNILASIDRIAQTTAFGDKKLLDGSAGTTGTINAPSKIASVAITGNFAGKSMTQDGVLDVNLTQAAQQATVTGTATYTAANLTVPTGSFSINGFAFKASPGDTVQNVVDKINAAASNTGVNATYNNVSNRIDLNSKDYGSNVKVNLTDGAAVILGSAGSSTDAGQDAAATVTYKDSLGATIATAAFTRGRGLQLKDGDGNTLVMTVTGGTTTGNTAAAIQISTGQSAFQIGANADQTTQLNLTNFNAGALGLAGLDITVIDLTTALKQIDDAISQVSSSRGNIGSFMRNTIETNMRSISITKESLTATESSIRDVDIAEEMTNFTKLQIIQNSGLSVLAQANQAPQAVLSLLRG